MSKPSCHDKSTTKRTIRSSSDVVHHLAQLDEAEQEAFWIIGLNARHHVLSATCVALGTVDRVHVVLRDVFRGLIRENAAAFIAAHNHPSGDPSPSTQDEVLTEKLRQAGELLGISLLDHVIIGHDHHYSFSDQARLPSRHAYGVTIHERAAGFKRPERPAR